MPLWVKITSENSRWNWKDTMENVKVTLPAPLAEKKAYIKPDIIHEAVLETKAGSPIPPGFSGPPVPGFSGDYLP